MVNWAIVFSISIVISNVDKVQGQAPISPSQFLTKKIETTVKIGKIGELYENTTNAYNEFIFEYSIGNLNFTQRPAQIEVFSRNGSLDVPILVVIRQQRAVMSWRLPLALDVHNGRIIYNQLNQTICPDDYYLHAPSFVSSTMAAGNIFIEVSTASFQNINFGVQLNVNNDFTLNLNSTRRFHATPWSPRYFRFFFPSDVDMVIVKVTSSDSICATVSVQNITCPVYDTENTVNFGNLYQTMLNKSGISVRRSHYPKGMFLVFVVHGDDYLCKNTFGQPMMAEKENRRKEFVVEIQEKISKDQYLKATFGALGFCGLFYLLSIILSIVYFIRQRNNTEQQMFQSETDEQTNSSYGAIGSSGTADPGPISSGSYQNIESGATTHRGDSGITSGNLQRIESDSSLSETDIDMLPEAEMDKNVFRTKTFLYVSDLARKDPRILIKKTQLYIWNLITVAIFYAVPVVQLVITYQKVLNKTGNQDLCYYNFLCAHPLGVLSDFNHVYSNLGYILLGLLFIGLVWRRDKLHRKNIEANSRLEKYYGIPRHFGLFYAMGVALMMEGILSACYHVCPNYSNFQFDTAFMYIIAVLCMLKIYQTRHPDINANAWKTFLAMAVILFLGVIGVLHDMRFQLYFWIFFICFHLSICMAMTAQIYYMGRWSLNLGIFKRIYLTIRNDVASSPRLFFRPLYFDRMLLMIFGGMFNLALAIYGGYVKPIDFASYLLAIFITNLMLYMTFYVVMKVRYKEKILPQPMIYIFLATLSWTGALYFFFKRSTSWQRTAAESRNYNRECLILNFYDNHDVWHFLSAASMFFGFMILLTLDDDLIFTRRDRIPVF